MLKSIFSDELLRLIAADRDHIDIDNIDGDFVELMIAGIFYTFSPGVRYILWIVGENENLDEKRDRLMLWAHVLDREKNVPYIDFYTIPFEDPYVDLSDNTRAVERKAKLIEHLLEERPVIIITTLSALGLKIEGREALRGFFLSLKINEIMPRSQLIEKLRVMGYSHSNIVEEQGDMAWRGSIVDVFPIDSEFPIRIEIEGDTVVSLRYFDPDTQKSLKQDHQTDHVMLPISRFFLDYQNAADYFHGAQDGMNFLTDFLGKNNYRIVISDKKKVWDESRKLMDNYEKIYEVALEKQTDIKPPGDLFKFDAECERFISINETWDAISSHVEWIKLRKSLVDLNSQDVDEIKGKLRKQKYRLFAFSSSKEGARAKLPDGFLNFPSVSTVEGRIPYSFENPNTGCIFLAEKSYRFVERIERPSRLKSENLVKDIQIGDYVVHDKHGIGKFIGFKHLTFEGHVTEFLKIEYLNSEFLYVPVYELDVLSKYAAFEGQLPRMDKMGGNSWAIKKRKAQKNIISFAKELLDLYAKRKAIKGNSFVRDYELEEKFSGGFQYVETEDQKRAIRDVLSDLEEDYPMDRLLCGDVSFGKTEVALRAALRVVANGKQVAVLCPTTILAYQHFQTFSKRFEQFPITVAMISRMVTAKQRKVIVGDLADGRIDIIIGTHSLISKDISFKRLGLYVIDEEQRFGVFQKEKIKQNREDIDVLSMSATPIPRTLSFSLAGLQDISTIQTPPIGRMAIKNYVGYYSREIVMSAILNELERDGLVFIVFNDINRIFSVKEEIHRWLPEISIEVIHAQMNSEAIERNLMDFIEKKIHVLISTTIIENGIDIPDVNTLIILDADRFGLTQLYQLRGRIGRGNRQAYAYFLVKSMALSDKAKARLDAIREFADLGSGYKLAEFDLKLRGAGSLLGNKQHGHIEALGFDYYHQLLVNTIKEMKGEMKAEEEQMKVSIHFSYSIDSEYIKNSSERISLYRRILDAEDIASLGDLRMELEDRYGRPPDSIDKIFYAGAIRLWLKKLPIEELDVYLNRVVVMFRNTPQADFYMDASQREKYFPWAERVKVIDDRTRSYHFTDYRKLALFVG